MTLTIRPEKPDQPDVIALLAEADARSASLYPAESRHGLPVAALLAAEVRFFVARRNGAACGCGGFAPLGAGAAEVKRLFVTASARGQGAGRALMRVIEAAALAERHRALFLETGVKSVEALALYRGLGFHDCEPFAAYRPDLLSVFMTKALG